ncbi:LptA/OstA family protein [Acidipila sp. EB88]|uniref:LptA/OstA family protein n=1 Tax=Acidipila sp. EB88 TaxID=2305226 RepID=UPI000F5DAB07|nr:LptA/OstA family protein [Acidipila sp. EB88]RRA49211.1 hypothetical protein D1Y84_13955 [Acidipila sp. EB88]
MARITIDGTRNQTIRTILIACFAALACVLLGFLGLKKLRMHGLHFDLPGQLGANITQTADGFTYSQSKGGHTFFTLHASSITNFKQEQSELHDVSITLYGPEGSHRQDRISGKEFLYDKNSGVVTAKGAVEIDMASPAQNAAPGSPRPAASDSAVVPPDNIHVQTSDLRFDQKSGDAQTSAPLSFILPRASGKAVGGDYNAKTGVLVLDQAVELHADQNGSPSVVYASHAQMLRDSHVTYLLNARSEYQGGHNSADQAILHFRPDGSIQHLDAENHVHMVTADGAELYSTTAAADFDEHSQPLVGRAGGGVNFLSSNADSSMHGNAVEGTMQFMTGPDGKAILKHANFHNAVSFVLQEKSLGGDPRGSATREMTSTLLDIDFTPGPDGKSLARTAVARGGATVDLHDLPYGAPARHSRLQGQQLVTQLTDGHEIHELDGSGGTTIINFDPTGATDTSKGDTLHATFVDAPQTYGKAAGKPGNSAARESAQIETALQQGHVTMSTQPARDAKQSDGTPQQPLYAEAITSTYLASSQTLHLTGDGKTPPRVHNDTLALTATTVDYKRDTGDATAHGDVRSTYLQQPVRGTQKPASPGSGSGTQHMASAGPADHPAPGLGGSGVVHVIGDSARMTRTSSSAVFYGSDHAPARMWQGSNSVEAPVLELGKQQGSLNAHAADNATGSTAAHAPVVRAAFAGRPGSTTPGNPGSAVTRVTADTLFYSDTTRRGDFHGNVVAQQPSGTLHSDDAEVFLAEAPAGQASQLDHIVATGHTMLQQPGRRGTGQRLVYTAADGNYVLTGTPQDPPHATDSEKGAVTGATLLFRSGDNSVDVLNADAEGNNRRTVTDTRTPK